MKLPRGILLLILTALTFGCATPGNAARVKVPNPVRKTDDRAVSDAEQKKPATLGSNVVIDWYTGGKAKLSLNPVPADMMSSIVLAGTTTEKTLVVKVAKKGGTARSNPVPLAADGSFNVRYLIKDGSGVYTVTLFGSTQKNALNYQGLGFFTHTVKESLPANLLDLELNDKVLAFVNATMGTRVGSGECWDLAQQALDINMADWVRPNSFGRLLNPEKDEIKAGDIIQFRSVKITEHLSGGGTRWETLGAPDHTAIIYKVTGKRHYTLAHQNVGGKRSVITSDANLANVTSGKIRIYRPEALMVKLEENKVLK